MLKDVKVRLAVILNTWKTKSNFTLWIDTTLDIAYASVPLFVVSIYYFKQIHIVFAYKCV